MSYTINSGISQSELSTWLADAAKDLGTFDDGRVDYTNAELAPIVMCTVTCQDKILLVKRGYGLADAEGYWSTVNGFIDEDKPVAVIALHELEEELGLTMKSEDIQVADSYTLQNPKEKRSYIVFPCLVTLVKEPEIVLDEEHTDYTWIQRKDLESYHILDDLAHSVDSALNLNNHKR